MTKITRKYYEASAKAKLLRELYYYLSSDGRSNTETLGILGEWCRQADQEAILSQQSYQKQNRINNKKESNQ